MRKVKTHWEVRRPKFHEGSRPPESHAFEDEAEARVYALTTALKGATNCYTGTVTLVEVETREELLSTYDQKSAKRALTPPRGTPAPDTTTFGALD